MRPYCGNTGLYYFIMTYGVVRLIRMNRAIEIQNKPDMKFQQKRKEVRDG
jgi:hypothetical protein